MKSLLELYVEHQGKVSDKWSIYLTEYDRLFSSYRNLPTRMLEIGIQNGGSLEIWSQYFPQAKVFVGCDINPDCANLTYQDPRIHVVVGDANTDLIKAEIINLSPNFDIVIDDGSHKSSDIIKTFAHYFHLLNDGGIFVAEDLHCSYWDDFEGGLYYPYSSISFFKRIADIINHEHWGVEKERKTLIKGFATEFSVEFNESHLAEIHSIEFFNSVCVVRKRSAFLNVLGERVIAGKEELIVTGLQHLARSSSANPQSNNVWTIVKKSPEEDWVGLKTLVAEQDEQLASPKLTVAERDAHIENLNQTVVELNMRIIAINQAVSERDSIIDSIKNSFLWKVTRPAQKVINRINPLRAVGRRTKKVIWWILTLQIGRKYLEWQVSRKVANSIYPHFSPPKNDYTFKVPFDYKIVRSNFVPKLAVIFHVYYPELIEEFKGYLANIPFTFDLFITTDTEEKKIDIANQLLDWNNGAIEIRISQNRGRDIAPKLISCRDVYDRYEFFLHIHTKKSPHHTLLSGWRTYLLDTLLGSKEIVTSIFEAFECDQNLGMIAPEHFDAIHSNIGWGLNFDAAKTFAAGFDINLSLNNKVDFPSGSMFWGRSAALRPLLNSSLSTDDFQLEGSQTDGTLGHIIERLYYFICEKAGYRWIKIARPELLKNVERVIFIDDKDRLNDLINITQYGLLTPSAELTDISSLLKMNLSTQVETSHNWRLVHAKSNMRTLEFTHFCNELEKHILKQESQIDFDESFYFAANPDLAENGVTCGFIHYCLVGQYENRIYSDSQLKNKINLTPSLGKGLFYPTGLQTLQPMGESLSLDAKPQSQKPVLLILISHLQEELFFAGYSEFFKDHSLVFDLFDQVIIAVENAHLDKNIVLRYTNKIEVIHLAEICGLLHKPDIIIGFNSHLTCQAYRMLPNTPQRVVYYCQDFESGFFPYGNDYIIGKKAILGSQNLIVSTELLKNFLAKRNIVNDAQQVFVTRPNIEIFDVKKAKTNRLFFYFRPESFNTRNLPEVLMDAASQFCYKHSGYEIFMVGSVETSYSFKINGTQIYVISKLPKNDYVELISSCDVVVAMIYSAHPGVIAFQAAASGIPTVTNVFENRDASLLRNISKNIVPYDPARENLLTSIEEALTMEKGQTSFNELLYSGNQQGTLVDFYSNILVAL